jgi:hypothetical protein
MGEDRQGPGVFAIYVMKMAPWLCGEGFRGRFLSSFVARYGMVCAGVESLVSVKTQVSKARPGAPAVVAAHVQSIPAGAKAH